MKSVLVTLNSIDKVKEFVNIISRYPNDFDLIQRRYVIDAKSMLGIFSLDLSQPIELKIHDCEENEEAILKSIKAYLSE